MTIDVTGKLPVESERQVVRCEVRTKSAAGEVRYYAVSLTDDWINGRRMLQGKRTDPHDHATKTPDGPTSAVYDAAREYFADHGFEVER